MTLRWYVVQTRAGHDARAWVAVTELGFEALFLQFRERRRLGRYGSEEVLLPLFPGYFFVEIDLDDRDAEWGGLLHATGVVSLLGMFKASKWPATGLDAMAAAIWQGKPTPLPTPAVRRLKAWERRLERQPLIDDQLLDRPLRRREKFEPGERVTVERADRLLNAIVQADQGKRIRLLLDMMGKMTPTIVARDSVEPRS